MKKFLYIILVVVFAWSGLAIWNWAPQIASSLNVPVQLCDMVFIIFIIISMVFSVLCRDAWKQLRGKNGA